MGIANWEKECLTMSRNEEAEYQCWLDSLVEEDQLVEEKKKEESSGKASNSN